MEDDTARAAKAPNGNSTGDASSHFFTLLQGIRPYDRAWLSRDIVAGITLAALAIPEVMGYTKIAGTPVITGLYTMLLPAMAFAIFGSSRHLAVAGDSATAAIMFAGIAGLGIPGLQPNTPEWLALASLSALIAGALVLIGRVVRLGFLADFISRTVLTGFLTGVGIQVAAGQVGGMLGVPAPRVDSNVISGTLIELLGTLREIGQTSLPTLAVSLATIVILVVFERWVRAIPGGLVAVVGMIAVSWAFDLQARGVSILGPVPGGLPPIGLPAGVTWSEAAGLLPICFSMFLVILAQSAATSRAYAIKYKERFVENNDLVGLSIANLAAGLSSTFVVNGSPTKTEMVDQAGSRTQIAQIAAAATVAIVLLFLTRPLQFLPNAVLSAVVFVIGLKLVHVADMKEIWRLRRDEFWIAAITTAAVVGIGVEQAIILAIVLSLIIHVHRHYSAQDTVVVWDENGHEMAVPLTPGAVSEPGLVVFRFTVGLFYANAERLMHEVLALVDVPVPPRWFILYADAIDDVDFTGGRTLVELAENLLDRSIVFGVAAPSDHVRHELDVFGVTGLIGEEHVYHTLSDVLIAFHASRFPSTVEGTPSEN